MPSTDEGQGTKILFGTTGFVSNVDNIDTSGLSREAFDTSHLLTEDAKTFEPTDLVDSGEIGLELHFDPDEFPPINQPSEIVTITWPIPAGSANGATWTFTAFMTNFDAGAAKGEKMTASATLKVSGTIVSVPAS